MIEYKALSMQERLYAVIDEKLAYSHPVDPIISEFVSIGDSGIPGVILDPLLPNPFLQAIMLERLQEAIGYFFVRGYFLVARELFRPIERQRLEFNELKTEFQGKYPDFSEEMLYRELTKYIADPDLAPPHSTGGAIDLYLTNTSGEILNMGTPINTPGASSGWSAVFHDPQISFNRNLLLSGMLFAGFAPLATEWWHFSYGDRLWGMYYDRPALFDCHENMTSLVLSKDCK